MPDPSRVYGGFTVLNGGMDGGSAPSLIGANQVAGAANATFRGGFFETRPPWKNILLTFADANAQAHWLGMFQGGCFYDAAPADSGWVVSRGGYLFRISSTGVISDITPQLNVQVTADFTVPGMNSQVAISVTDEKVFTVGDTILIDGGTYVVNVKLTDQIDATYTGGAAHATAVAGTPILDSLGSQIIDFQTNPADYDFIFCFQAENYVIVLAGQQQPIIYDGSKSRRASKDSSEVPPGAFGVYGWGRIWIFLPDRRTFVAGNLVFDPSGGGTATLGYRDSILKFTENTIISGGGAFGVPYNAGLITGAQFLATNDTSTGLGVLLVGTENMVFSVNAPVDRAQWQNLAYPIQTVSLLEYGPLAPRCMPSFNSDLWYRSTDGFRSFITAQRQQHEAGNTPLSFEVSPIIDTDTEELLFWASGMTFDNRLIFTCAPRRTVNGIVHDGLAAINFDLVSKLSGKAPAAWEGALSGLDVLQLIKGRINGKERGFAFALNPVNLDADNNPSVELWEFLKDGIDDQYVTVGGGSSTILTRKSIQSWIETRADPHGDPTQLKRLRMAELYFDDLADSVTIVLKFRPDQYPLWITWATITLCATVSDCQIKGADNSMCFVYPINRRQYASRVTIGQPPESCNSITGTPMIEGYEFQYRLDITGHCRVRMFKAHANAQPQTSEGDCNAVQQCTAFQACEQSFFDYSIH